MAERYGDYELIQQIAAGGMAEIHLARQLGFGDLQDLELNRLVIIKRMLPQLAVRPDFVQMFLDEARLTSNLQHPNIVRVHDLGEVGGSYFIAMELVDGPHLGSMFAHSLRARKPLPIELCAWVCARAADGLHYAHECSDPATGLALNLVHRDISPQNILISKTGESKVTDFGVAKASNQQTKTRTGIIKGKVAYMSPEQCLGETLDRRSDVFALGVVLYELLTRRRLFRDKSDLLIMQKITGEDVPAPSTLNVALDPVIDGILKKALARNLAQRYGTADEMASDLDGWLAGRADERGLAGWFEEHCAELAPSAALADAAASVTAQGGGQGIPGVSGSESEKTSATPSLSSAETMRHPAAAAAADLTIRNQRPAHPAQHRADPVTPLPGRSGPSTPLPARSGIPLPSRSGPVIPLQGRAGRDEPTTLAPIPEFAEPSQAGPSAPAPAGPPLRSTVSVAERPDGLRTGQPETRPAKMRAPNRPWLRVGLAGGAIAVLLAVVVGVGVSQGKSGAAAGGGVVGVADGGVVGGGGNAGIVAGAATVAPLVAPTAPAGATGKLKVETIPPNVAIIVGDRVVGRSPIEIDVPAGPAVVQAQFTDQPVRSVDVDVPAGGNLGVLIKAWVPLVVRSTPPRAKVRVDGQLRGETPYQQNLLVEPGVVVKLRLEAAGMQPWEESVVAEPGKPLVVEVRLVAVERGAPPPPRAVEYGALGVKTTPWTNISFGDEQFGNEAFQARKVKAGRQILVVTNPKFGINESLAVTVPKDRHTRVVLRFDESGSGKLTYKSIENLPLADR